MPFKLTGKFNILLTSIIVHQNSETNVIHFLFSLLRIKFGDKLGVSAGFVQNGARCKVSWNDITLTRQHQAAA
jgi:hypothetical protein